MIFIFFLINILFFNNYCFSIENELKRIKLTTKNSMILKGAVDENSISRLIHEINLLSEKSNIYLYLDTNGGSVESGHKLISEILNHNISCIAEKAYSMGFAILQSCKKRYLLRHGKLMIHQVQFGLGGEMGKVESYIDFIKQMEHEMMYMMSQRMSMTPKLFKEKMKDEWWLYSIFALNYNAVDEIISVECSKELTKQNLSIPLGSYDYIYSRCPLVTKEIAKIKNKNTSSKPFYFEFI